jgi:hypothetical protein
MSIEDVGARDYRMSAAGFAPVISPTQAAWKHHPALMFRILDSLHDFGFPVVSHTSA